MGDLPAQSPATRFLRAAEAIEASRQHHTGLAKNVVGALARAQRHTEFGYGSCSPRLPRSRSNVASVLGLRDDQTGHDAAGLVLALFDGLLDPTLAIDGDRMQRAQARLRTAQPIFPLRSRGPGPPANKLVASSKQLVV